MTRFITPHGGVLKESILSPSQAKEARLAAHDYPSWDLSPRQLCHIELLLNGGFSPLEGFMGEADYGSVLDRLRLADGTLWPIPITLDVPDSFAQTLSLGKKISLRDPEGVLIAVMELSEIFMPQGQREAQLVYGTLDPLHAGVDYLLNKANPVYLGGRIQGVELPSHYDFKHLRRTPRELRDLFKRLGWEEVIAFQPHHPIDLAIQERSLRMGNRTEAHLLIHPISGENRPQGSDHYARIRCYEYLQKRYAEGSAAFNLLPLAPPRGSAREALWHAIVNKNYGCTHFIARGNQSEPKIVQQGERNETLRSEDARSLLVNYQGEIGIEMVPFHEMVFIREEKRFIPVDQAGAEQTVLNLSEIEPLHLLEEGVELSDWVAYPEVIEEFATLFPPRHKQGFTVFFTGLSGAGKSTIAKALLAKLMAIGRRSITLLDGDIVRKHLSSELGFSQEHRDLNILRIGFVASEITKHGGIAICAPIAPYRQTRSKVRELISCWGGFIEVYVATPLEICEGRDRKGLYAKARAGLIKNFTGINDPYEDPEASELIIDTRDISADQAADKVIFMLKKLGYIQPPSFASD